MSQPVDIAIVGLAGAYAGARDAQRYWQNILDKVDAVTDAGPRWTGPYYDPDAKTNDRIYTTRGGFLHDSMEVNPIEFGVLPSLAEGGDPDHLIALKYARDALADAGYGSGSHNGNGLKPFDPQRAGVVIGRGTYGNRGMASVLARGLFADQAIAMARALRPDLSDAELRELHDHFRGQLPVYNADMVGVLTPNVIAGLIANRLNMMGPNFIVDAACSSSLIALDAAVRELTSGRCDLMLTGGVHSQTPPQLYIQFCQIQALSHGDIRPFQKGANGILLGEGVGMLVLKRLADAERDGDRIYAVVKGIGTSSDGRAKGLLTPRLEGQVLALQRAYESSGIDPMTIDLIEAHGTGTEIGDRTEIETLKQIYSGRGTGPQIAVGSVKSMIAHCLPAAGSASMIKMALALHHKVLPPMICDEPNPALRLGETPFYINNETRPWIHGAAHPRRAAANAFGFGGINAHVVLEEYEPGRRERRQQVAVLHRPTPSELVTLGGDSITALLAKVDQALLHLRATPPATLAEVAHASGGLARGAHRLAIVADNEADLIKKLEQAREKLARPNPQPYKTRGGVYYGHGDAPGKVCFLYPGEGGQYPNMLADVAVHFPPVREAFDFMEKTGLASGMTARAPVLFPAPSGLDESARKALEDRMYEMDVAAESVFSASLGLQALLDALGFAPDAMLGHSTGENTALTACRVRRTTRREEIADSIRTLNKLSQQLEAEGQIAEGTLLTLGALKAPMREALLRDPGEMIVAMDNCPNQLVMFGPSAAADALREKLSAEGVICVTLPFGRAYHTPLFKPFADALREYFKTLDFGPGRCTLYSARSVGRFPSEPNAIRELAAQQWENPVRFTETLTRLYEDGYRVFVEVGPSGNLTSFVGDTLRAHDDVVAVACNSRRRHGVTQLHQTLGQLYAAGVAFQPGALYSHRDIDDLDLMAAPKTAKRRGITIDLQMPELSLPADWAPLKRRPAAAAVAERPANVVEATARAKVVPIKKPADTAAVALDPRSEMLRSHFALMQDFLDSQSRVLAAMTGTAPLPPMGSATSFAPSTIAPTASAPMRYPLLGRVIEQSRERLVCERRLDHRHDRFLQDHAIGGTPSVRNPALLPLTVVPFTFSMEILAEAAAKLVDGEGLHVIGFEESRGSRWLALDGDVLDIRIQVDRGPPQDGEQRVAGRIFALGKGGPATGTLVFESSVRLAAQYPQPPAMREWTSPTSQAAVANPDADLYRNGMFHGPRLQGVKHIERWGERSIEADIGTIATHDYFDFTAAPRFEFDAAALDAVGALAAYWVTEQHGWSYNCFPFRVGRCTLYAPPAAAGQLLRCRADTRFVGDTVVAADFDLAGTDGRLAMRIEQWEDRKFPTPQRFADFRLDPQTQQLSQPLLEGLLPDGIVLRRMPPFDEGFLDQGFAIWKRVLAHMALDDAELRAFYALPASGPRREEWLMGRIAAKDAARRWAQSQGVALAAADIGVDSDALGAPHLRIAALPGQAPPSVSISHSARCGVAAIAPAGMRIGVDYQPLAGVDADRVAIGALHDSEHALLAGLSGDAKLRTVVALWAAKEAAAKAAGSGLQGRPQDWHVIRYVGDASVGAADVQHGDARYVVMIYVPDGREVVALCLA
ncbi:type I polyketide synthase [Solimonas marina]|uniref:Acyltransferase domain-containing protein n=1 Tax=Solimonas marina TaxID=2714601 RepID=A0A970B3M4_9GAMM|nr:type I polyketide synthase [Solimonas marina]NKF21412.1 acyltransferase domain-containing protein [Solimonas marina]